MGRVCVIGLPKSLGTRVERAIAVRGLRATNIFADKGKEGTLKLVPHHSQADAIFNANFDETDAEEGLQVYVLPYAPIPGNLDSTLKAISDLGAKIERPMAGENGWPSNIKPKYDQTWLSGLFNALISLIPAVGLPPAAYFEILAAENSRFLILAHALDRADSVAPHRYNFLRDAADALDSYAKGHCNESIDSFFKARGLEHAQTGGIQTILKVRYGDRVIYENQSHTHLKQGNKTTPAAAVRVYYQAFDIAGSIHVALFYAGPHPEQNISGHYDLPNDVTAAPSITSR